MVTLMTAIVVAALTPFVSDELRAPAGAGLRDGQRLGPTVPRRARTSERGAAVVDFVLVLLVLLPLVIGILQLALVLHVRNTLASAAAEGARHAAVAGSSAPAGRAKVQELVERCPVRGLRPLGDRPPGPRRRSPGLRGRRRGRRGPARLRRRRRARPRLGPRHRRGGTAVTRPTERAARRAGLRPRRVQLARDHPAGPAGLDRHLGLRGAAGRVRHQRRRPRCRTGVRPGAGRRDRERRAPRPSYGRCWPTRAPPASAPG